jgi:hypothetical protein
MCIDELEIFLRNADKQQRASVRRLCDGEFFHITTNFQKNSCVVRLYKNGVLNNTVLNEMGYGQRPYIVIVGENNLTDLANELLKKFKMVQCPRVEDLRNNPDIQEYLNENPERRFNGLVRMENGYPFIPVGAVKFWCGYYDVLRNLH